MANTNTITLRILLKVDWRRKFCLNTKPKNQATIAEAVRIIAPAHQGMYENATNIVQARSQKDMAAKFNATKVKVQPLERSFGVSCTIRKRTC
jgi:hypothetical protein